MPPRKPKPTFPGMPLQAREWSARQQELYRQGNLVAQSPLQLQNAGNNPQLRWLDPMLFAEITGRSGTAYSWKEVLPMGDGSWVEVVGGRKGTFTAGQAYEANGLVVSLGAVVELEPGLQAEYLFVCGCGAGAVISSSSSLSSSSGSTSSSSQSSSSSSASSSSSSSSSSSAAGSSSSSSSAAGGTVTVACCGNPIPTTLYLTFTGAMAALGTVTVTWTGGSTWAGAVTGCGGGTATLFCARAPNFQATVSTNYSVTLTTDSCSPFAAHGTAVATGPCAGSTTVTVSA